MPKETKRKAERDKKRQKETERDTKRHNFTTDKCKKSEKKRAKTVYAKETRIKKAHLTKISFYIKGGAQREFAPDQQYRCCSCRGGQLWRAKGTIQ